ncbi:hypothetical protein EPO66_06460, partial [bacterium]
MNKILKNAKFLIPIAVIVIVAFSFSGVFGDIRSGKEQSDYAKVQKMLDSALKENQELKAHTIVLEKQLNNANNSIRTMDIQLKGLKDIEVIKGALTTAEGSIDKLNKELKLISDENVTLKAANVDLKNRIKNIPDIKTLKDLDQLKATKEELQNLNKFQVEPLKQNIQSLEKKIKSLEAQKTSLEEKLTLFRETPRQQDVSSKELAVKINALNAALSEKDSQIFKLETKIGGLQEQLNISRQEVTRTKDLVSAGGSIENKLRQAEDDLDKQKAVISVLTTEKEKLDLEVVKLRSLANDSSSRENVDKLSSVLVKKELELEKARREAGEYKEKITNFQSRMSDLEKNIALSDKALSNANELQAQIASLQVQLKDSQTILKDKSGMVDELQKNVNDLTSQLANKDREKKDIESKVSQLDSTKIDSQKELLDTKAKLDEINTLYSGLRAQVSEVSGVLAQKELDLDQKRKEVANLSDELAAFKTRSSNLEKELTETKERQRKTLDNLAQALKINADLQDRILEVSRSDRKS